MIPILWGLLGFVFGKEAMGIPHWLQPMTILIASALLLLFLFMHGAFVNYSTLEREVIQLKSDEGRKETIRKRNIVKLEELLSEAQALETSFANLVEKWPAIPSLSFMRPIFGPRDEIETQLHSWRTSFRTHVENLHRFVTGYIDGSIYADWFQILRWYNIRDKLSKQEDKDELEQVEYYIRGGGLKSNIKAIRDLLNKLQSE